ncbi:MAG: trigger factor [Thiovulaceae bacterium]|nr:trigger factor [Sulfurimonadaceae bacterium]
MKVNVNKIDDSNVVVTTTLDSATIDKNIEKVAKQLTKTANVSGFRKGKVPAHVIKQQYGEKLTQDAESEALREVFDEATKELKVEQSDLIGEPQVTKFEKTDKGIEVEIKLYVRPKIDLGDYKKIIPDVKKPKITKKAVSDRLKELAEAQAAFVDVTDRTVEDNDTTVIDFEGFIDGAVFPGGKAEEFSLKIGSAQFIPGFEEQLIGMAIGEEKEIKVTFPADYQAADLAGKEAMFKVKLHKIQIKEKVRIDKKLAEKMLPGEKDVDVEMLNTKVEEQLQSEELSKTYNEKLKPDLIDALVKHYKFTIPEFIVEQEMDNALNKKAQTMSEDEINALKDDQDKVMAMREEFREDATKSVKATFIIDSLALAENIRVDEQEVQQTIYYEAMQTGQDPQATLDQYTKAGYLPAIQMSMVEDRVLSKLLDEKMKAE